jgi:hypothetical protein
MTTRQRKAAPDTAAMRFLLEYFIDVPDGDEGFATDAARKGLTRFQAHAARVFLPGPQRGDAYSLQQLGLMGLRPVAFQQLRRDVRDWLRPLVTHTHIGHTRTLKGPLTLTLVGRPGRLRGPYVEGEAHDVFWFYLVNLLSRAGLDRIGVCWAPMSMRDPAHKDPMFRAMKCLRLFVRRGTAKEYCSARCRARVATRRARKGENE